LLLGYRSDDQETLVRFLTTAKDLSVLQSIHTCSAANTDSSPIRIGPISLGIKLRGVNPTSHLHLISRSRIYGVTSQSPIRLHAVVLQGHIFSSFASVKRVLVLLLGYNQLCCFFLRLQKRLYNHCVNFRFQIFLVKANVDVI
jgi:hypothetical protein